MLDELRVPCAPSSTVSPKAEKGEASFPFLNFLSQFPQRLYFSPPPPLFRAAGYRRLPDPSPTPDFVAHRGPALAEASPKIQAVEAGWDEHKGSTMVGSGPRYHFLMSVENAFHHFSGQSPTAQALKVARPNTLLRDSEMAAWPNRRSVSWKLILDPHLYLTDSHWCCFIAVVSWSSPE